jgi:hypothetical protein
MRWGKSENVTDVVRRYCEGPEIIETIFYRRSIFGMLAKT